MKATALAFRFRSWIVVCLYLVGFLAPWKGSFVSRGSGTVWLAASTLIARTHWMSLSISTLLVTAIALCCCAVGAIFRVWGSAFLGPSMVHGSSMNGDRIVVDGPYCHLRNPLYLGNGLLAIGISILMPPSGALFFLVALFFFQLVLILGEERFLSAKLGAIYSEYRRRVHRLWPSLRKRVPSSGVHPRWLPAILAEICPVGFSLCFAIFAWRYDWELLIRCLLICCGLSLVACAFAPRPAPAPQERGFS